MITKHTPEMAKNHRQRMRDRLSRNGINSFDEYQLLEMVLFEFIPRVDTYPMAHRLIDTFGSVPDVFFADKSELEKIDGIGKKTAEKLVNVGIMLSAIEASLIEKHSFTRAETVEMYLECVLAPLGIDSVCILFLDGKDMLIGKKVFPAPFPSPEKITEEIERGISGFRARKVILAHKHPEGDTKPSPNDINVNNHFERLCHNMKVEAKGHYIVAGDMVINTLLPERL